MEASPDPTLMARELLRLLGERGDLTKGASKVERLFKQFTNHEFKERKTLEEYREAIEKTRHPTATFLLDLICRDEERHAEVINAMVATFQKNRFRMKPTAAFGVFRDAGEEKEALLSLVKNFIRLEREGIREYELLLADAKDIYEGLFSVLLRALIKDSEKHLLFLEYLRKHLGRRWSEKQRA